jgi:MoxR-like ATPase
MSNATTQTRKDLEAQGIDAIRSEARAVLGGGSWVVKHSKSVLIDAILSGDRPSQDYVPVPPQSFDTFELPPPVELPAPVPPVKIVTQATDAKNQISSAIADALGNLSFGVSEARARELALEEIIRVVPAIAPPRVVIVKREGEAEGVKYEGEHQSFADLLTYLSARDLSGYRLNVYLPGPAGSGKTTAAHHVADALKLDFYPISVGPQTTKHDLFGYQDANGNYHSTVFRKAFEFGGVFLLDEVDAGNPAVLTALNAALANGQATFPDGVVKRHIDFVAIAAGNTYGAGATAQYVGRNPIDAATLDRFVFLRWGYDKALEQKFAQGNTNWLERVWRIRSEVEKLKAKVIISPRAILQGVALFNAGVSIRDVEAVVIFDKISDRDTAKRLLEASEGGAK